MNLFEAEVLSAGLKEMGEHIGGILSNEFTVPGGLFDRDLDRRQKTSGAAGDFYLLGNFLLRIIDRPFGCTLMASRNDYQCART